MDVNLDFEQQYYINTRDPDAWGCPMASLPQSSRPIEILSEFTCYINRSSLEYTLLDDNFDELDGGYALDDFHFSNQYTEALNADDDEFFLEPGAHYPEIPLDAFLYDHAIPEPVEPLPPPRLRPSTSPFSLPTNLLARNPAPRLIRSKSPRAISMNRSITKAPYRKPFSLSRKKEISETRGRGACLRCKYLKKECKVSTAGGPCDGCVKNSGARVWHVPCTTIKMADLAIYKTEEWTSLLRTIMRDTLAPTWFTQTYDLHIFGGVNGPTLTLSLSSISPAPECPLSYFALKNGITPQLQRDFDSFADGLVEDLPQRIFIAFLSTLLNEIIDYAKRTKDILVMTALKYYAYCRLTHAFLRGLCYEGYHGGIGVGVWIRDLFRWDDLSTPLKTQLLSFASQRVKDLEKELFRGVDERLKKLKQASYVPEILTLSVLVDQLDCNIHEGRWLEMPANRLLRPRKTPLLHEYPMEHLGSALSDRASALAELVLKFACIINDHSSPNDKARRRGAATEGDQLTLASLREKLSGPRIHLLRGGSTFFVEQLIFPRRENPEDTLPSGALGLAPPARSRSNSSSSYGSFSSSNSSLDCPHSQNTCSCTEAILERSLSERNDIAHLVQSSWDASQLDLVAGCNCPHINESEPDHGEPRIDLEESWGIAAEVIHGTTHRGATPFPHIGHVNIPVFRPSLKHINCRRMVYWNRRSVCLSILEGEAHSRFVVAV
ncbi:MAG: hypothetical protein M1829_003182 [Trizodia sp. TS-e1964]|nr:MAG: hypothetical protein M1829_003182 [Trizodia sp. TS-e1964]